MANFPKRRRLFFDIETSPNVGFFWGAGYKLRIGTENIITERSIICIAWKWAGQKKVYCLKWDKDQNDKALLVEFLKVLDSADEIVAHNGDRFDVKWIRTRCIKHGIQMMPNYTSIDTLKAARGRFRFNSNRLDYIARFLGLGGKIKTDFNLWKRVVLGKSLRALAEMVRYCKYDVELLERVFDRLNSYLPAKSVLRSSRVTLCPECGSGRVNVNKHRISAAGRRSVTFQCADCGKYHTIPHSKLELAESGGGP